MHGGTVLARSDGEGKGSEFVVRLPLASAPAAEALRGAGRTRRAARRRAVVVVEDNADSREMLCELLETAGYDCQSARQRPRGADARRGRSRPTSRSSTSGCPEIDGFEIARRIRADARHAGVRLVALTGYGQAADRAASLAAGFDEHLVKPVQPDRLLDLLARLDPKEAAAARADATPLA